MDRARRLGLGAAAVAAVVLLLPGAAGAAATCAGVETTPDEGHLHLLGDAPPVGYRSTPPASGWHYRERERIRLGVVAAGEPLSEAEQVSVLAVGGVVVSYGDLPAGDVASLESVVAAAGGRPVALTPYEALEPGEVALSAWRRVQRCDGVDLATVEAFVTAYAAAEPDFTMSGDSIHEHPAGGDDLAGDDGSGVGRGEGGTAAGDVPAAVLAAAGLVLLAGFVLATRRALRPHASAPAQQSEQRPVSSRS